MAEDSDRDSKPTEGVDDNLVLESPEVDWEFDAALSRLDEALDRSGKAAHRFDALAALTVATAELNGLLNDEPTVAHFGAAPDDSYLGRVEVVTLAGQGKGIAGRFRKPKSDEDQQKVGDKVQKYWGTVEKLVEKYQPSQYQITVGFPIGISVTLSWDVNKPPGSPHSTAS